MIPKINDSHRVLLNRVPLKKLFFPFFAITIPPCLACIQDRFYWIEHFGVFAAHYAYMCNLDVLSLEVLLYHVMISCQTEWPEEVLTESYFFQIFLKLKLREPYLINRRFAYRFGGARGCCIIRQFSFPSSCQIVFQILSNKIYFLQRNLFHQFPFWNLFSSQKWNTPLFLYLHAT